jgi:hypothetical protein
MCHKQKSSFLVCPERILSEGFENQIVVNLADPSANFINNAFEDIRPGVGCVVDQSEADNHYTFLRRNIDPLLLQISARHERVAAIQM